MKKSCSIFSKRIIAAAIALVMMFFLTGMVFAGGNRAQQRQEKVVTMGLFDVWATLNPFPVNLSELSAIVQAPIYLELARVLPTGEIHPLIMESYQMSPDGMTYRIKIRENMLWHDGMPLTAEDIVWTFHTLAKPEGVITNRPSMLNFAGVDNRGVELSPGSLAVRLIDRYTFEWDLKYPMSPMAIFFRDTTVLPKHVLERIPVSEWNASDYWYTRPIGSGPFKFDSIVEGERVEYVAFDQFPFGRPDFDRLIIRTMPQANLLAGLMSGDIDILAGGQYGTLPVSDAALARQQRHLHVESIPAFMYQYISMNNSGMFSDVRVRQAVNHAIDKQRIVNEVLQGEGIVAVVPYSANHPFHNPALADQFNVYNPARARALLAEAGWDSSRVVSFGTPAGNAFRNAAAVLVQQDLAAVGINVEIRTYDNATLMTMLTAGDLEMATMGSAGSVEPHEPWNLYNPDGPFCFARLTDYTYAEFFNAGLTGIDTQSRAREYHALQSYIIQQMPYSYLCNPNIIHAYNSNRLSNVNPLHMLNAYRAYWEWEVR